MLNQNAGTFASVCHFIDKFVELQEEQSNLEVKTFCKAERENGVIAYCKSKKWSSMVTIFGVFYWNLYAPSKS